jgi:hypothetical protein
VNVSQWEFQSRLELNFPKGMGTRIEIEVEALKKVPCMNAT